jgi:perosamine synthetase
MESEKLAVEGGPKTVQGRMESRATALQRGLGLCVDLARMFPFLLLGGKTTITDGSGVVEKFEQAFRALTGADFALAMTNGTATLHSAYFAAGVGPGTEAIVPSYTWTASATPILQCGATPVFCDIDPRTLTADPDDIERRITERTRAICVVHVWGNPAEMDRIMDIAGRHHLIVIEDCSHAHGSTYKGKSVGRWGHIGCFSLNSSKPIDGGEAGIAVTSDPVLYDRMLLLGHFGRIQSGQAARTFNIGDMSLGMKYRPHVCAIQWAVQSLKRLQERNERGGRALQWLREELGDTTGLRAIEALPDAFRASCFNYLFDYELEQEGGPSRDQFVAAATAEGVPISVDRYTRMAGTGVLLHQSPLFTSFDRRQLGGGCYDPTRPWSEQCRSISLPVTESIAQRLVSMPYQLYLSKESYVRSCGRALRKVLRAFAARREETASARRTPRTVPEGVAL